jgi:beta-glucosidase
MFNHLSRRQFVKGSAGIGVAASTLPGLGSTREPAAAAQGSPNTEFYKFPSQFRWGCATAAYQIEGGANEGGRGKSIWDTFSHTPGKVYKNQNGDLADDDYHRYKEDVQLLKDLGARIYRFSISWPRIFPDGTGKPNEQGLAFYERVVETILAAGIEPFATLFHWDLPQALQDRFGGWQSRKTAEAFAEYAG